MVQMILSGSPTALHHPQAAGRNVCRKNCRPGRLLPGSEEQKIGFGRSCSPVVQAGRHSSRKTVRSLSISATAAPAQVDTAPPATAQRADDGGVLDCVIVGAGVSGLCTAMAFSAEHPEVGFLVTEGRERVGGNITTCQDEEGYLWEEGPNSFQPSDAMLKAAVDAGIEKDLVLGDPKAPRFVYWDNKLRPTPSGPDVLTFDLLSIWGKIRAGLGAVGIKKGLPEHEESVEQYVRRNLGDEVFERLIEPFCSGVYAGDPSKLSMKAAFGKVYNLEKNGGSIIGGALKMIKQNKADPPAPRDMRLPPKPAGQTVGSFRRGLKQLPDAIAAKLSNRIRVEWKLKEILRSADGTFTLAYDTPEGEREVRARSVALTIPAWVAAPLLQGAAPDAADVLKRFDYPPVAAVTVAYPVSAIRDERKNAQGEVEGFGQLHPRSQGVVTLGTIYSSSLFPDRAPAGMQLLLNYIGGAQNRGILEQSSEQLVAQVDKDLRKMLLKPDAPQPKVVGVRVWPRAIPQFNIAHLDQMQAAKEDLKAAGWQGVHLGGNYAIGVALGKCVEYAYEYATEIADFLQKDGVAAGASPADEANFL